MPALQSCKYHLFFDNRQHPKTFRQPFRAPRVPFYLRYSGDKMTQKPQPLVPWMGGKRRLAKHLIPMFPEHSCYVELFAGGAALFFLRPQPAKCEVLNDIDGQLINLYRVVQHHFDEFVRQFDWILTSREVFCPAAIRSPGEHDRHPASRPFLLLAAHRLWRKDCSSTFWYDHHLESMGCLSNQSKADSGAKPPKRGIYRE